MSIKKRLEALKAQQEKKEAPKPAVPVPGLKTEGDKGLVEPPQAKPRVRAEPLQRKPPEDADSEAETRIHLPKDSDDAAPEAEPESRGKEAGAVIDSEADLFAAMERESHPDESGASSDGESIEELGSSQFSVLEEEQPEPPAEESSSQIPEVSPSSILDVQDLPLPGAKPTMDVRDSEFEELSPIEDSEESGEVDIDALAAQARSSVPRQEPPAVPAAPAKKKTKSEGAESEHWLTTQAVNDKTKLRLGYIMVYTGYAGAAKEFTLVDGQSMSTGKFSLSPGESRTFENLPSKEGPLTITIAHTEKGVKAIVMGGITKGDKAKAGLKKVGQFLADNSVAVIGMVTGTTAAVIGGVEGWLVPWLGQLDVAVLAAATLVMDGLAILHIRDKYKRNDNVGEVKGE